jgi:SAM-dependent methyltransferase
MTVWEIGAGAGGILEYMREKGNRVFGCDLDGRYLEYGRERYGLDLVEGTVDAMARKPPPDLVIYSHVLEHVPDPVRELATLKSFCRPGTLIYVSVPGLRYLTWSYGGDLLRYVHIAHIHHFTKRTLLALMGMGGFTPVYMDESINCICRSSDGSRKQSMESDYPGMVRFLRVMEVYRHFPVLAYAKEEIEPRLLGLLARSGLDAGLRRILRR